MCPCGQEGSNVTPPVTGTSKSPAVLFQTFIYFGNGYGVRVKVEALNVF